MNELEQMKRPKGRFFMPVHFSSIFWNNFENLLYLLEFHGFRSRERKNKPTDLLFLKFE